MVHFTYCSSLDDKNLKQGDILRKTPELEELLKQVHPHYARAEYLYYQILTQSCDLVLRGGAPKSRYITLAAVRNVDIVIQRFMERCGAQFGFGEEVIFSDAHKTELKDKLRKLVNNNDKDVFFLKSWSSKGLKEDCCTFLHLSVAVRAEEHYQKLLSAKIVELEENFRAKLGWMVGNLYSRVGTEDYVPGAISDGESFEKFIDEYLDQYIAWVPSKYFRDCKKVAADSSNLEDLLEKAQERIEKNKTEKVIQMSRVIAKGLNLDNESLDKLENIIKNDSFISSLLAK